MDSEKLYTTKLLTTWWDLIDHYVLAVMFAVSIASVGLQASYDRLICIPVVNCSGFARNDPVVRKWSEFNDVLDTCNQSSSSSVLTKMSDLRQYDYIDNECYKEMHWFSSYYSLIFLVEAVLLLAISNFWQKYPNSASALAHCEHLLSDFTKGDFVLSADGGRQQEKQKEEEETLIRRLEFIKDCYNQSARNVGPVTLQYRLRGAVGLSFTIAVLGFNYGSFYSHSTEFTQCHLHDNVVFSTEHGFFQCTRSMGTYFHVGFLFLTVLLLFHLFFVLGSILWSVTGQRRESKYVIEGVDFNPYEFKGDAGFLFHLIHQSNSSFLISVINRLFESGRLGRSVED